MHVVPSLFCHSAGRRPAAGPPAVGSSLVQPKAPDGRRVMSFRFLLLRTVLNYSGFHAHHRP
ncbi:hypothetical protein ARZXY2_799 [Arthrobacter sp. ZXY-2]|nr:hypothetical protein ARZXY2_799 [Arthrobacter sp. ZXY-2]